MMIELPFSALKMVHSNLTNFMSSNDNKFDFIDTNRIPYAVKFNPEIENFFAVADENGFIKLFKSFPKIKPIKEFNAQKSCIYDLQWLNSHEIACGGGDQHVSIIDVNTSVELALLKGHTESVRSIAKLPLNPFVLASGSRDGSILIFDVRFNRTADTQDSGVSYIRAVNNIQKAHFVEDSFSSPIGNKTGKFSLNNRFANVLKTKSSNLNNLNIVNNSSKRSSPVASICFQNDNLLISAGATDGLIKVWDTRKMYTITSNKKNYDNSPLYVFDNTAKNVNFAAASTGKSSKGYSSIVMNASRTRLYANCLNNHIYEYNYQTYNQNHVRLLNNLNISRHIDNLEYTKTIENCKEKPENKYHTNHSNYIKASVSNCDNFILSGSSNFNAYIYSTNVNSDCLKFRKHMPVIVLKGHTNEVTAVDWNPLDSNQIITCSDDNTIRSWNVKRDIDILQSNEFNFCLAETVNEFEEEKEKDTSTCHKQSFDDNDANYLSKLSNRKYYPFLIRNSDDLVFSRYEFKNFIVSQKPNKVNDNNIKIDFKNDLENELCLKWNNINIDNKNGNGIKNSGVSYSTSNSEILKSIENKIKKPSNDNKSVQKEFFVKQLQTPTSNMPINIITKLDDKYFQNITVPKPDLNNEKTNIFRRQNSNTTLLSVSSLSMENSNQKKLNAKTKNSISNIKNKKSQINPNLDLLLGSPQTTTKRKTNEKNPNLHLTPKNLLKKITVSTAKKRHAQIETELMMGNNSNDEGPRTPVSKRRLILDENLINSPSTPKNNSAQIINPESPIRTILHYFSPKPDYK